LIRGKGQKQDNLFKVREEIWSTYMVGVHEELGQEALPEVDGRPTIGMQRSLYTLQTGVLWAHFFDRLGFRLVLTPPTNSHIASTGIECMTAETCFPVRLSLSSLNHNNADAHGS
jgi:predicted nucleotide-binding protein (sugar kinase/HSP70/actin superfamily)